MGTFSRDQAKKFYDRLGWKQDWQAFYGNPAIDDLVSNGRFETAQDLCEFGCGTGRLAERLLIHHLPATATYLGLDISTTMVRLARARVKPWSDRAHVLQTDGTPKIPAGPGSFDRVISTYVLDLLSDADIQALSADAKRVLRRGGLFCNVSLTFGQGPSSKAICALWQKIHNWGPALLGGCRPMEVGRHLDKEYWSIKHRNVVSSFGVCSEIIIAEISK